MRISQKIKNINLADIVTAEGVKLRRHGNKSVGICPFHSEKTGSFTVFEDNHFKCFGCGEYGDAVDFVQRLHGYDFEEAIRFLGIEQGPISKEHIRLIELQKQERQREEKRGRRESNLAYTLAFLIRSAHKAKEHITPYNLNEFADTLDSLSWWVYCHEMLCLGTDDQKRQCCENLKDMPTIKRNSGFKPGFDFVKWLRGGIRG